MSVSFTRPPLLSAEKVLYARDEAVNALAIAAITNMVEANIDMITDCAGEYKTKADIEAVLNNADAQAIDFLHDAMDDLKKAVLARVREGKLTVRIKAMKFCDVDGELDDVDAEVKFE
jgi:glyceraldehyde-3-phosphate dehydrogenase/erythrose-4-phosphate dehydrogenase